MTKLESPHDIKDTSVTLQEKLLGSDIELIRIAERAFNQLADRFCQENEGMMVPLQYEVAKDFEYFMRLVDLTLAYFADGMETSGQIQ
ncbi:MAG: hypothetical protein Q7J31_14295 [Syntrophales bacterium]|nr:hypothetical protein [Syntrophales bacterium]